MAIGTDPTFITMMVSFFLTMVSGMFVLYREIHKTSREARVHTDKRFDEARAHTDACFKEARAHTDKRCDELQSNFNELRSKVDGLESKVVEG